MSAVLLPLPLGEGGGEGRQHRAQEPSAKYLAQLELPLVRHFDSLAASPGGVAKLRELILTLAVQGKLVPQDPNDEPASVLLKKIRAEKDRLVAEGKIKRNKPLAEIAAGEEAFELPPGWCSTRVEDICTVVTDGEHATPQRCDDTNAVPLVTAKNVRHEVMDYTVTDFVPLNIAQKCWQRCKPAVGDILMVSVGATLGRLCVLRDAVDMVLVRSVTVLRPAQSGAIPDFLARHLMSPGTQLEIWREVKQSAQPCLYLAKSAALKIALPPLAEQSRIVARVEELMRLCDALEAKGRLEAAQHARLVSTLLGTLTESDTPESLAANWQRIATHFDLLLDRPEAVDALEQTTLQLAVRGLLVPQDPTDEPASALLQKIRAEKDRLIAANKIKRDRPLTPIEEEEKPFESPVGWAWVRFGDVAVISSGVTLGRKTAVASPVLLPYLRVANVQRWHLNLVSMKEVVVGQAELERLQLSSGDLLITEGGDWDKVGRTAIWRDELPTCLHQNHVFKARGTSTDWNPVWAELYLNSAVARTYFASAAKQTTNLASINMTQLKNCVFPVPPLAEQSRIVARVEALRCLCADLRQRLSSSQTTQAHLADALVAQAA